MKSVLLYYKQIKALEARYKAICMILHSMVYEWGFGKPKEVELRPLIKLAKEK